MKKVFYNILDFFLPQYCTGCNKKLNAGEPPVCNDCFKDILPADSKLIDSEYERKFERIGCIQDFLAPYIFESEGTLQNIIHSLKYNKKFRSGVLLGKKLAVALGGKVNQWEIDLIVPVPLHHLKKAERGFNQTDFITRGLSSSLEIPFSKKTLKRIRFTESQTKLNLKERVQNVTGAFEVKHMNKIIDKNILLVDDVITTGATINECAKVFMENGANEVYACSVAIAE